MNDDEFQARNATMVAKQASNIVLQGDSHHWLEAASKHEYSYHFTWQNVPIIQHPQDVMALQEIIWATRPDLIVETGIARGGSLLFYASMMELMKPREGCVVFGVDIDIKPHLQDVIENTYIGNGIYTMEASSVSDEAISEAKRLKSEQRRVSGGLAYGTMVVLDSDHTHKHVLAELNAYAPLVTPGCYLVVFDTIIEYMPESFSADRPWGPGNSPATAVAAFLKTTDRFEVDTDMDAKLLISAAPGGYLRCVK